MYLFKMSHLNVRDTKFNGFNLFTFQDSSNGTAKSASSFASVSRFSAMSQRIKSSNEPGAGAVGDAAAAAGRKGSQSSTIRDKQSPILVGFQLKRVDLQSPWSFQNVRVRMRVI